MSDLQTERLLLRQWTAEDRAPFAELNADVRVMQHFPAPLSRAESDQLADRIELRLSENGYGLWAVEIPGVTRFAGFIGLAVPSFEAHFTPCVEIGWRLAADHWGQGYAPEGAKAALEFAFDVLELDEVVSFTPGRNLASRRVMEKLGMTYSASDDFEHPSIPEGHELRRLVLYRKQRPPR